MQHRGSKGRFRYRLLILSVGLILIAGMTHAQPSSLQPGEKALHLSIAAQPLGAALKEFARQSGLQLAYKTDAVGANLLAPALTGTYTADAALSRLLAQSGLHYAWINAETVSIQPDLQPSASPELAPPASSQSQEGLHPHESTTGAVATQIGEPPLLEEIVVTGSHIRGAAPVGSELIVIGHDEIEKSGYVRVEDLLAKLPQNFNSMNENTSELFTSNVTYGSSVNLRGLGSGATLILVNGMRQAAGGTQGAFTDISSIPMAAIDRIEVLPDGVAAIYGADAVGGVVNIILRRDYQGAETNVTWGVSDGSTSDRQLSQTLGLKWSTGNLLGGLQYLTRDAMRASSVDYLAANGDFRPFGGSNLQQVGSNPGVILTSARQPAYTIPNGQNGSALTTSELIPGLARYADMVTGNDVLPRLTNINLFSSLTQTLSDSVQWTSDVRYGRRQDTAWIGGQRLNVSVPATNPYYLDPFGGTRPVTVAYDFSKDLGALGNKTDTQTWSADTGLLISLPNDWRLSASVQYAHEYDSFRRLNVASNTAINAALADSNPTTALNVFGDGSNTSSATLNALRGTIYSNGTSSLAEASVIADGSLFRLPGGAIKLATGLDLRRETLSAYESDIPFQDSQARTVYAGFAELVVPIVDEPNKVPGVQRLTLSLAGREEHYSDFGSTSDPKLGFTWSPVRALSVQGSWGRSFRAAPFNETSLAVSPIIVGGTPVANPKSPTGLSNILFIGGNNPDLAPEKADTWSAGLAFDGTASDSPSMSLTYYSVTYTDKIGTGATLATALADEPATDPVLTKNPTPTQIEAICANPRFLGSCTGPIAAIIDLRLQNISVVHVAGMDGEINKSLRTMGGVIDLGLNAAYMLRYEQALTVTSPSFEYVNTVGYPIKFRGRARASWTRGRLVIGGFLNYYGRYSDPGNVVSEIGSWTTLDTNASWKFGGGAKDSSGVTLQMNAVNVFDTRPPFVNQPGGYDPTNASIAGRLVSATLRVRW